MKFPAKGILPSLGIVIFSIITIWVGVGILGVDPGTVSVFTLFATWFAFIISTGDGWPLQKVAQPGRGFIFLVICLIYGILHMWAQPALFGFSSDFYWPAISNLFLAIGITISFDGKLVQGLKQPAALIMNILFWYLFAFGLIYLVPINNGMIPSIWFAFFLFYFFWMDRWPITNMQHPQKGILSLVVMGSLGFLLNYIFIWLFGTNFFQPDAGCWFACWVFWLVLSSWNFDTWPLQKIKQPAKGLIGLVVTVALAFITYFVIVNVAKIPLSDAGGYVWIFICWAYLWPICLGKWPAKS